MSGRSVATSQYPLGGVKILELATNIAAPMGSFILAEQGADVIKVEPPTGDPLRLVGTRMGSTSSFYASAARGKRSIGLDLKTPEGQQIVKSLAKESDVLLCNYRPGVMARLNLGSEELRAANPKLIYVDVTGYGQMGPMKDLPAYDTVLQAMLGYTEVQGNSEGREYMKTIICDKVTGYTAAQAITAALLARAQTGTGQHIDISMVEACLYFLWPDGMLNQTFLSEEGVSKVPPMSNFLQKFETADGAVTIAARKDEHYAAVFELIGEPELIEDPRFCSTIPRADNLSALYDVMMAGLRKVPSDKAIEFLREHDVMCAALQSIDEALEDPQVKALGAVQQRNHPSFGPMNIAMPPIRFDGEQAEAASDCALVGQNTREILGEIGYDRAQIDALEADGTVIVAEVSG